MTHPSLTNLRLLVERTPDSGFPNLVDNPSGDLGGWGWLTPRSDVGTVDAETNVDPAGLRITWGNTESIYALETELKPITAGKWYRARVTAVARIRPELDIKVNHAWYDADRNYIAAVVGSADILDGSHGYGTAAQPPAGAVYVSLQVFGSVAQIDDWVVIRDAMLTESDTDPGDFPYSPPFVGRDILGPSHDVKIEREGLNAGTLDATLSDLSLDPAVSDEVRPGRRLRLEALVGGEWTSLFAGKINHAEVNYDLKDHAADDPRHARITLTATDNASTLAAASRPRGVATVGKLPWVLEGAGVPWDCNGETGHVETAAVVATNDDATALDQVAIVRDSVHGHAWVTRVGVLRVYDPANMPAVAVAVLDETTYSDLDVGFSTDECINEVEVTILYKANDGTTKEKRYGPFTDVTSVAKWGRHRAAFRVQGISATSSAAKAFADAVLTANADPGVRVREVTLPVRTAAEVARSTLDLYDRVLVTNADKGISHERRITSLVQEMTPSSWHVTLEFEEPSSVASPQATPSIPSAVLARETGQAVQTVKTSITLNNDTTAVKTVTWPAAFTGAPVVVATCGFGGARYYTTVTSQTATEASIRISDRDANPNSTTVDVNVIAVGPM